MEARILLGVMVVMTIVVGFASYLNKAVYTSQLDEMALLLENEFEETTEAGKIFETFNPIGLDEYLALQAKFIESEAVWNASVQTRKDMNGDPISPWEYFLPTFNSPFIVERVGSVGKSGKWVSGVDKMMRQSDWLKPCAMYSYGIPNGDLAFELEFIKRTTCFVHIYDNRYSNSQVSIHKEFPLRATFSRIGLGVDNNSSEELRTLKFEMDSRGYSYIDILKLDLNGSEFGVMEQILQEFQKGLPFGQLLIKFNISALPQEESLHFLMVWWEKLESAGLRPFHRESYSTGLQNSYEYSFLNTNITDPLFQLYEIPQGFISQ